MSGIQVSVIITNHNYAPYLGQCLQSVLDSDFSQSLMEIIVVDDASNDNSLEIARKMMTGSHFPITIIANDINLGVTRSRNRGIVHARGELVFILDADNYIDKHCLITFAAVMRLHPEASACYGPILEVRSKTGEPGNLRSSKPFDFQMLIREPYIDAMAMFRRKDLLEAGMYDTKMPPYGWEDYELWLRMGSMGKVIAYHPGEPLAFYRVHSRNKSQNYNPDHFNQLIYYLKHLYGIRINFIKTDTIEKLIHQQKLIKQLYYPERTGDFDEHSAIVKDAEDNPAHFIFPAACEVVRLRFDPLNDYVVMKFREIRFYLHQTEVFARFRVTTNADAVEETNWYFGSTDPQIIFEFDDAVILDEVVIDVEYLKKGTEVIGALGRIFQSKERRLDGLLKIQHDLRDQISLREYEWQKLTGYFRHKNNDNQDIDSGVEADIRLIRECGLFDIDYYLMHHPDVEESGMDAAVHFFRYGGFEGRTPSIHFDPDWYMKTYPDVAVSGMNPLLHFVKFGQQEGRLPKNPDSLITFQYQLKNELVSIVMPAFNAEESIAYAIRSIQHQTRKEWELIVVDDGSKDDTAKIAERMAMDDNRIIVHKLPENRGAYAARNHGIRQARGKFITFHDADDIALPVRIEYQLYPLLEGKAKFSIPGFIRTSFSLRELSLMDNNGIKDILKRKMANSLPASDVYFVLRPCLSMAMFKREIFEEHGLYWETRFAGDVEFVERIFRHETGMTFNEKKNDLRNFIIKEKLTQGLFIFFRSPFVLCPAKVSENLTRKYPMGGIERETFIRIYKNRLIGIGDYEYPTL